MVLSVGGFNNGGMPRQFRKTLIRQWRKFRELTLEELAERVDMTASHLSMLERGHRGYTQETLESLAKALQTDPGSLLNRDPYREDEITPVWSQAKPAQRRQILEVAKTLIRTAE